MRNIVHTNDDLFDTSALVQRPVQQPLHDLAPVSQPRAAIQQVAQRPAWVIADMDGALRALGEQLDDLALVVDGEGRAIEVAQVDVPIPYALGPSAPANDARDHAPTWPKLVPGLVAAELDWRDGETWPRQRGVHPKATVDAERGASLDAVPAEGWLP